MKFLIFGFVLCFGFSSCTTSSEVISSQTKEVHFQLIDSLVVESLMDLYVAGKNPHTGQYLFKDRLLLKGVVLTDSTGKILAQPSLRGEGPNQVPNPWEIGFAGNEIAIKEMSAESKVHFFDTSFKKLRESAALGDALNMMEVAPTRNGLTYFESSGQRLLIGSDLNSVSPELMAADQQNVGFYSKATPGFTVGVQSGEVHMLNLYPDTWLAKMEGKWAGTSLPFLAATSKSKIIGVLPRIGDQLFFYRLINNELIPIGEALLNHPDRKRGLVFSPEDDPLLYPSFFDLKASGIFFLIHFYTEVPKELYLPMKVQGTNNSKNPEHVDLLRKYRKSKYLLVDERGSQAAIARLPIEGQVHYIDADDILYIKPATKVEKDYNVFYRYKIKF